MAKRQPVGSAAPVAQPAVAQNPNGDATPKEKTIITEFTLKLQRHKDVPSVPTLLDSIDDWAKEKGYLIDKKETSTPGYYSWAIHTAASLEDTRKRANNVMKEVRSMRDDDAVKAAAQKLGITVDDLLKRTLAKAREELLKG